MKRVAIGISGGVDSSVAALLLKNQGYEVVGITFIFNETFDSNDAISICKKIGIEHHIIDYKKEFNDIVINSFVSDYKNGITPNPCVLCNKYCKFKFLFDKMIELNCDFIATGHYAKVIDGKLLESVDLAKDQTYFLSSLTKEQLNKILFPLEGIDKTKVREIALEYGLINANKKDSTDVCFITDKFNTYINKTIKSIPGDVIDITNNKIIGTHNGLMYYTIGQRRGLNIGGNTDRLFVVGKNIEKNILYVSIGSDNEYLYSDSCILNSINFNVDQTPDKCMVKFRYRSNKINVSIEKINNKLLLRYDKTKSVTPGQVASFYIDNQCIGSGIIEEVRKDNKKLWYLL